MAEILEKNRTIQLELLLIDPALSDGIRAYEEDAFRWETADFKRLNYMTLQDLEVKSLKEIVARNHGAGLLTMVLIDRINSQLVRNLSQIGDELVSSVKLVSWERFGRDLMNFVDYPQIELFDGNMQVTVADKEVYDAFVSALRNWMLENMDISENEIEEIVEHARLIGKQEAISSVPSISENKPPELSADRNKLPGISGMRKKLAAWLDGWLEEIAGNEPSFEVGAAGAGGLADDAKPKFFGFGTSEETLFEAVLKRGGRGNPDRLVVKAVCNNPGLMEELVVAVALRDPKVAALRLLQLSLTPADDEASEGKRVLYLAEAELEEGVQVIDFEIRKKA